MRPTNQLRAFDEAELELVKDSFREIWAIIEHQNVLHLRSGQQEMKIIISKLLELVDNGVTDKQQLKEEVLRRVLN
jgi:DNA-binding ferritin-like protein (Dps family)